MYVLFVFSCIAILCANKQTIKYILPATFAVSTIALYLKPALTSIGLGFSLFQLFPFMLGVFIGWDYKKIRDYMFSKRALPVILFLAAAFAARMVFNRIPALRCIGVLFPIYAVFGLAILLSNASKNCVSISFEAIGRYSMEIYVLHHPLLVVLRILLGNGGVFPIHIMLFNLIGIACSIIIPIVASKYILRQFKATRVLVLGMN